MITNSVASTGARVAIPPMRPSDSTPPARAAIAAMSRNSGATTSPWLTICITAPWAPSGSSEKIPSVMNPSCATELYPTTSRTSSAVNATTDP